MSEVSVIIPCYNCEDTIVRTLNSLEKQSYKEFEVILINDGSTDLTEKIILEYISRNILEINYIYQLNRGVSISRNKGIAESLSENILFLDADDTYHKDFIKIMYSTLKKNDVDTVYSLITRDIEKLSMPLNEDAYRMTELLSQSQIMNDFLFKKESIVFASFIYKKKIILKNNIHFPENKKTAEDLEFTWKYLCHCKSGYKINNFLYCYYKNSKSVTNTAFWERTYSMQTFEEIGQYLKKYSPEFSIIYDDYMYSRVVWSYAKTFSIGRRKDLFDRLTNEFNMKNHMKKMVTKSRNWKVSITALLYYIHPDLFYKTIMILNFIKG